MSCSLPWVRPAQADIVHGIDIPNTHPRLWFTTENLPQARAWYANHPITPSNLPERGALDNAYIYMMTGDASRCAPAVAWALNQPITDNGTASNDARWYGESVYLIWDWCYDQMSPTDRTTLMNNWNTYNDRFRQFQWGGPSMVANNYHWGYLRNELSWAITSHGENSFSDTFFNDALVTRWQNNFIPYSQQYGRGGVPTEGHQYGRYLLRYGVVPFRSMALHGRDIYSEANFFKEAVFYLIYGTTPQPSVSPNQSFTGFQTFSFSDDQFWTDGNNAAGATSGDTEYGDFMTMAANHWSSVPVGQYARSWLNLVQPRVTHFIRSTDISGTARAFDSLPLDYFASGPGVLYGRNRWGSGATLFHLIMGHDAYENGHNHQDWGFQLWRNGRWISRETTGYNGNANFNIAGYGGSGIVGAGDALAHNMILMNGAATNTGQYASGPAQTVRLESHTHYSYAVANLTPALRAVNRPQVDNPAMANVVREYLFLRAMETLVIFDRLESNTVGTVPAANIVKTFLAHFESVPTIDQSLRTVTSTIGTEAARLITLVPANPTYRIVAEGGSFGQQRLELETSGTAQSYFLNVLQAKGSSDPDLSASVVDNGPSYTATLTHPTRGTVVLTLNKGMGSAGGSVTIAGQTYPLHPGIQSMTVNDAGPVWATSGTPTGPSCDNNQDGFTNIVDVQLVVNQAVGSNACSSGDINQDSLCNVIDVQRVVNAALGGSCVTQ